MEDDNNGWGFENTPRPDDTRVEDALSMVKTQGDKRIRRRNTIVSGAAALIVIGLVAAAIVMKNNNNTSNIAAATTTSEATTTTIGTTTTIATTTTVAGPVPTMGKVDPFGTPGGGQGWGAVKPKTVDNGGDPSGLFTEITWDSWGGTQAIGHGKGLWVAENEAVANGTREPATIVAFNLGTCDGKYMYQAVEWYFPQHGETFDSTTYENICTGDYVGSNR